jgi:hypothetical protein
MSIYDYTYRKAFHIKSTTSGISNYPIKLRLGEDNIPPVTVGFSQDWNTQPYSTNQTTVNSVTGGILNLSTTGIDPFITMYSIGSFAPTLYNYIVFRYRILSGPTGYSQIFFTNSRRDSANADQYINSPNLINDGEWHICIIKMSDHQYWYHSNITGWRYDYYTQSGATMEFDYIRLVGWTDSIETVYIDNFEVLSHNTVGLTVNSVTNSIINLTSTSTDPQIQMYPLGSSFDPNLYTHIDVKYRILSGGVSAVLTIFFMNSRSSSPTGDQNKSHSSASESDGNWYIATLDMSTNYYWRHSNINGLRLDPTATNGITMEIDYIKLYNPNITHCSGICQSDFRDIYFANSNNDEMPYWIENTYLTDASLSGTTMNNAEVWVNCDDVTVSGNIFYMYYGSDIVSSLSSIQNVFPFGDDFSSEEYTNSQWTVSNTISGGILDVTTTTYGITYFDGDCLMRAKSNILSGNYHAIGLYGSTSANYTNIFYNSGTTNNTSWQSTKEGSYTQYSNTPAGFDNYHIYEFKRILTGTDMSVGMLDGFLVESTTTNVPIVPLRVLLGSNTYTDWVYVYSQESSEPLITLWGDQEYTPDIPVQSALYQIWIDENYVYCATADGLGIITIGG